MAVITIQIAYITMIKVSCRRLQQYISAVTVSVAAFSVATISVWTGNTSNALLTGRYNGIPINMRDLGWITALPSLAATFSTVPGGIFCDKFGRKPALLAIGVIMSLGWLTVVFANSIATALVGRFVMGIGIGPCVMLAPLYNVEIAENEVRGKLAMFYSVMLSCGVFFSYVFGHVLHVNLQNIVCAVVAVLFTVAMAFQDETPGFSVRQGNVEGARKTLLRLRGMSYDVEAEICAIATGVESKEMPIMESLRKRSTKIAFVVCCGLVFFQHFGGTSVVLFYANEIFTTSGSTMDPSEATMILGALQVLGSIAAFFVVEVFRRKVLLITSFLSTSLGLLMLSTYFMLKDRVLIDADTLNAFGFLPVLGLAIFITMAAFGVAPLIGILAAELYPPEIKGSATSITTSFNWLIIFLIGRFYGDLKSVVGGDVTFLIFGVVCLCGSVFTYFVIPDTKNKSLEQIQLELNSKQEKT